RPALLARCLGFPYERLRAQWSAGRAAIGRRLTVAITRSLDILAARRLYILIARRLHVLVPRRLHILAPRGLHVLTAGGLGTHAPRGRLRVASPGVQHRFRRCDLGRAHRYLRRTRGRPRAHDERRAGYRREKGFHCLLASTEEKSGVENVRALAPENTEQVACRY